MYDIENDTPELNITPLVDIMLVLLAILMVTTPAIIYEEQIALPQGSEKKISENKQNDLIVRIDSNRMVFFGNISTSLNEFSDNLVLSISKYDLNEPVFIQADKNLIYNDVMLVLKTLKDLGFTKVALQTAG